MTMTDLMQEYGFLRPTKETPILNALIEEQLRLDERAATRKAVAPAPVVIRKPPATRSTG